MVATRRDWGTTLVFAFTLALVFALAFIPTSQNFFKMIFGTASWTEQGKLLAFPLTLFSHLLLF